ncbi:MAG: hypothetical protein ACRD2G_00295 [Terriglobia bacterium]
MGQFTVRRILAATLLIVWCVGTEPQTQYSQACCSSELPTSEATQYGQPYKDSTFFGGLFVQTLSGPADYSNSKVEELQGNQGQNSCYFPGDLPGQYPTIFGPGGSGGSSWTVTSQDQWGGDFVGMFNLDAQQIWDLYETGSMSLPCYETTFQHMKIFCNQLPYDYDSTQEVIQSRVVNTDHTITTQRASALSPEIGIP